MSDLYSTPPSDEIFNEVLNAALGIWGSYSDEFGYRSEKQGEIKSLSNISDNFMYIVSMFDQDNQLILSGEISQEAREAIRDRLTSGGTPDFFNMFI